MDTSGRHRPCLAAFHSDLPLIPEVSRVADAGQTASSTSAMFSVVPLSYHVCLWASHFTAGASKGTWIRSMWR